MKLYSRSFAIPCHHVVNRRRVIHSPTFVLLNRSGETRIDERLQWKWKNRIKSIIPTSNKSGEVFIIKRFEFCSWSPKISNAKLWLDQVTSSRNYVIEKHQNEHITQALFGADSTQKVHNFNVWLSHRTNEIQFSKWPLPNKLYNFERVLVEISKMLGIITIYKVNPLSHLSSGPNFWDNFRMPNNTSSMHSKKTRLEKIQDGLLLKKYEPNKHRWHQDWLK